MKLKKWLYGATALAMLAACSDRDFVDPGSGGNEESGEGYVGIKIQLPTTSTTRANDEFDDGVASEYKINNAKLLLFQVDNGATDNMANAKCIGMFDLRNSESIDEEKDPSKQITTHVTRVANVSGINSSRGLYTLVMINANDIFAKNPDFKSWIKGKTIQQYQEYAIKSDLYTQTAPGANWASNIFMTNSPLSTVQGGANNPGTVSGALPVLVKLNNAVYETESEALKHPAGIIHVERAVGKVTCSKFNKKTSEQLNIKYGDYEYTLTVSSVSWGIAQDMESTYVVRNTNRKAKGVDANDQSADNLWTWDLASSSTDVVGGKHRMLGHTEIVAGDDKYYRPYFCQVPGYGKGVMVPKTDANGNVIKDADGKVEEVADGTYEDKKFIHNTVDVGTAVALNDVATGADGYFAATGAFYPLENTFPVDYMKYANTTRIGFWVTFDFDSKDANAPKIDGKKNFYISGADKSVIYFDDKNGIDPLTNLVIAELSNIDSYPELKKAIDDAIKGDKKAGFYNNFNIGQYIDFEYDESPENGGAVVIKSIKFKSNLDKDLFAKVPEYTFGPEIIEILNGLGQYYRYKGGKVFYEARIKHFGDDLTPWSISNTATTILESYGDPSTRDADYLGRYGIVRNNWYDLQVELIKRLGDPVDPALWDNSWGDKPDDNKDQYIAVILRVLSWAKRTQSVTF